MVVERFYGLSAGLLGSALLSAKMMRRRLAFALRQNYFVDLEIAVPLGHGLACPVTHPDHWHSFSEIFLQREYEQAFKSMPLPTRWLDLGCHAGYFSLYVAWLWAQRNCGSERDYAALLLDGDPRVSAGVDKLVAMNQLDSFIFRSGVIGYGALEKDFLLEPVMSSAALPSSSSKRDGVVKTPVIGQQEIMQIFPPPYDLIKIDVEGAEYEFLQGYDQLIACTKYLLLEWHSWGTDGGGMAKIREMTASLCLEFLLELVPAHDVVVAGKSEQCGVLLFSAR